MCMICLSEFLVFWVELKVSIVLTCKQILKYTKIYGNQFGENVIFNIITFLTIQTHVAEYNISKHSVNNKSLTLNLYAGKKNLHFISVGHQPGADLGPVISPASKERICDLVQSGADQGAKVTNWKAKKLIGMEHYML